MKIAILLCALAGCIDPSEQLSDIDQAVDLSARDRFISLNTDGNAWSRVQAAPNSSTYGDFELLGDTGLTKLATDRNQDGRLSVFATGSDGALWGRYQTSVGGGWNPEGWQSMGGGWIVEIATARNVDGRIEVFVRNQWGNVFHRYQVTPNGAGIRRVGCHLAATTSSRSPPRTAMMAGSKSPRSAVMVTPIIACNTHRAAALDTANTGASTVAGSRHDVDGGGTPSASPMR